MLYFATLFDINYLSRGLSLLYSLNKEIPGDFHLYILALDEKTSEYFNNNSNVNTTIITLAEIELYYPELNEAKGNRTKIEYYFTLSPILPLYILNVDKKCDRITTLDADIYFYSSPNQIFDKYSNDSILITPHDFSYENKFYIKYGIYNVSFQSFPNNKNSRVVLEDWKEQCLNWCKDQLNPETGYFADQKYLDTWVDKFINVKPINLKTCGRAPWNISSVKIKHLNQILIIDNEPLVYYHFHHLRINGRYLAHGLQSYGILEIDKPVKKLYVIYSKILQSIEKKLPLSNQNEITRYKTIMEKNLLLQIWRQETGAIFILNHIVFYNIIKLKKLFIKVRNFVKWQN